MTTLGFMAREQQFGYIICRVVCVQNFSLLNCSICGRKERAEGLEKASRPGHRKNPERLDKIGGGPLLYIIALVVPLGCIQVHLLPVNV